MRVIKTCSIVSVVLLYYIRIIKTMFYGLQGVKMFYCIIVSVMLQWLTLQL